MRKYSISDEELVKHYKEGCNESFNELVDRYNDLIHWYIKNYHFTSIEYEELYQIGLISLWKAAKGYEENRNCKFTTFFKVVFDRNLLSAERYLTRKLCIPADKIVSLSKLVNDKELSYFIKDTSVVDPEEVVSDKDSVIRIGSYLKSRLTEKEYKTLMYKMQGKSYSDIAKILNTDIKAIDNNIQRAKRKCRDMYIKSVINF